LGKHAETAGIDCHAAEADENRYAGFLATPTACESCHEHNHGDQFVQNGTTDCARCHDSQNWDTDDFDHDQTAFKLEGQHARVACEACHKPMDYEGTSIIQYKFNSFACIDWHQ